MRPGFVLLVAALAARAFAVPARGAVCSARPGVQPLDRILPEVRRSHPGDSMTPMVPSPGPDGSQHYHLKWMTPDGRIEWLDTDARTGRVLGAFAGPRWFRWTGRAPLFRARAVLSHAAGPRRRCDVRALRRLSPRLWRPAAVLAAAVIWWRGDFGGAADCGGRGGFRWTVEARRHGR